MILRNDLARTLLALGLAAVTPAEAQQAANEGNEADPKFKMQCASGSTRFLPKGNAGVGNMQFALDVDPAAQQVTIDGLKQRAIVDKFEISFRTTEGPILSISRTTKTFRYVAPIKNAGSDDSRQYILYEGSCQTL